MTTVDSGDVHPNVRRVIDAGAAAGLVIQPVRFPEGTKTAADAARKAAAYASLWLFITLLMGAFAASLLATYGGRQRDL